MFFTMLDYDTTTGEFATIEEARAEVRRLRAEPNMGPYCFGSIIDADGDEVEDFKDVV